MLLSRFARSILDLTAIVSKRIMPTKKKPTVRKSAKRSGSKISSDPNSVPRPRKKRAGRPIAAYMKHTSPAPALSSPAGKQARRSEATQKLWIYIRKNGLANHETRRPIFNTPVQLRNLDAADITRMLSSAKVKLS
jgi:hypothetical protein